MAPGLVQPANGPPLHGTLVLKFLGPPHPNALIDARRPDVDVAARGGLSCPKRRGKMTLSKGKQAPT